ncbi:MAG: ferrous iron transport protein A [Oscillospiraceae bacterium]|nr:ferrous iron transport protein A [Oscillospiraceae bacterium]
MTLEKVGVGETRTVERIDLPDQIAHRLEALGMTLGTPVLVLERKEKGPSVLKVRGTRFALGRGITQKIEVV